MKIVSSSVLFLIRIWNDHVVQDISNTCVMPNFIKSDFRNNRRDRTLVLLEYKSGSHHHENSYEVDDNHQKDDSIITCPPSVPVIIVTILDDCDLRRILVFVVVDVVHAVSLLMQILFNLSLSMAG